MWMDLKDIMQKKEKPILICHIVYGSIYVTSTKQQNCIEMENKVGGCQGLGIDRKGKGVAVTKKNKQKTA